MSEATDAVRACFAQQRWPLKLDDDGVGAFVFEGAGARFTGVVRVFEARRVLYVATICPVRATAARAAAMVEAVTRANRGMVFGAFEFDHDDGQIRFKTGLAYADDGVRPAQVRALVDENLAAMDRYLPALDAVARGMAPAAAVAAVEADDRREPGAA